MTFPNRVAESPASGLDDSSFLAPSQQVVPQVGVWILIIAFTLDFLDSDVAASRWSSHFFPLSPPVHWCWQERRSSSGIIFQLEWGGEGGNCRPLGILHWGCRGGQYVCNCHTRARGGCSPVRYIDMTYRLSIYQHFWKISISISISIRQFQKYRYRYRYRYGGFGKYRYRYRYR